ncbi:unnamed protein product [Schistocephalus solidus]|uniref:Uncharacterized protein n=1 Tax=Schistocephalus solidus TaxID=70667 RepID=A0A183SH14_SCHSO|nr:unnamed protein product [Schistocephalus solidus]
MLDLTTAAADRGSQTAIHAVQNSSPNPPHHTLRGCVKKPRSKQLVRRTTLVARELVRCKVDIAVLSETRFSEQGRLEEMDAGNHPKAEQPDAGVAYAIPNDIVAGHP